MAKYRKKPVVICAERWLPIPHMPLIPAPPVPGHKLRLRGWWLWKRWQVRTMEGWLNISPGDWIICGVEGEFYPCKASVFAATYEPAEDQP